jgi:phage tail-like protein
MIGDPSTARGAPLNVFNFHVTFTDESFAGTGAGTTLPLVEGAFAEVSGLEATMEAKTIREGGLNHQSHQRVGQVSHATVVLRRGVTRARDLWRWFDLLASGHYTGRLTVAIELRDGEGGRLMSFRLLRALPVKFKAADLNARASEVGIEEVHLVHEGLEHDA